MRATARTPRRRTNADAGDTASPRQRAPSGATRRAKQSEFLEAFRETSTLAGAARTTGTNRSSHYRWLQDEPAYAAQFSEANEEAADELEQEARRRALDGVDEPVFFKGERIGSFRRYSDQLLILLLMAKRPEQFRERVDVTSKVDHGLVIDPEIMKTLTDAEIKTARMLARKLAGFKEKDES